MYVVENSPTLVTLILGDFLQNHLVTLVTLVTYNDSFDCSPRITLSCWRVAKPCYKTEVKPKVITKMGLASFCSIF
jgi:hypothetical protein